MATSTAGVVRSTAPRTLMIAVPSVERSQQTLLLVSALFQQYTEKKQQ